MIRAGMLRLLYDDIIEAPNNLTIALRKIGNSTKNEVDVILDDSIIYKMTCESVEIVDRFIVGKMRALNFQFINIFDTLTKTGILSKLKGIAEEHNIREFKCTDGMVRVRIGDYVSTKWVILNNQFNTINKEFYSISDVREDESHFYFNGYRAFKDQYKLFGEKQIKMDKKTGEIVSIKPTNILRHIKTVMSKDVQIER